VSGKLGSEENPLRVAIVGSGPSGFYATEALLRSGYFVCVDMLEQLPAPYGLVRNGVAPDHPKLKEAILVYDRIARGYERVRDELFMKRLIFHSRHSAFRRKDTIVLQITC
jgi:cation diffusion facilitator CzcD-associated flavoprotein CzcO